MITLHISNVTYFALKSTIAKENPIILKKLFLAPSILLLTKAQLVWSLISVQLTEVEY